MIIIKMFSTKRTRNIFNTYRLWLVELFRNERFVCLMLGNSLHYSRRICKWMKEFIEYKVPTNRQVLLWQEYTTRMIMFKTTDPDMVSICVTTFTNQFNFYSRIDDLISVHVSSCKNGQHNKPVTLLSRVESKQKAGH